MIDVLETLADERRLEIVRLLRSRELPAGEIAGHFDVKRPTVSHHLSVLRRSGLVRVRRDGTRRLYSLRPERFRDLTEFFESFWDERLERLRRAAEAEGRKGRSN